MTDLQGIAAEVQEQIPLSRHLGFEVLFWDGETLRLGAALAPNVNDKGTLFAGSQSALLTLGGWLYVTLLARPVQVDVVAAGTDVRFLAPVAADAELLVSSSAASRELFQQRLSRKGRAPLELRAGLRVPGHPDATTFRGNYLATRREG